MINSRPGHFIAPSQGFLDDRIKKDPFFRSYGANLPSSLTRVISRALVFSTFLPVLVLIRSPAQLARSCFSSVLRQSIRLPSRVNVLSPFNVMPRRICQPEPSTGFDHHFQSMADLAYCVTSSLKRHAGGTGILSLFPITYAFRPWLRGRLTLGGRTLPRKSQDFGVPNFHRNFRYSCPHDHFHTVHARSPLRFDPYGTLLYHFFRSRPEEIHGFGSELSPDHFRCKITRLVSYYALFK